MGTAMNGTASITSYQEYFNKETASLEVSMHVSQTAILIVTNQFTKFV